MKHSQSLLWTTEGWGRGGLRNPVNGLCSSCGEIFACRPDRSKEKIPSLTHFPFVWQSLTGWRLKPAEQESECLLLVLKTSVYMWAVLKEMQLHTIHGIMRGWPLIPEL